jgi:(4-alkanoyl-5-oxo-2,5-dihydrofuran-3-yl)methyl phosphate reductase
MSSDGTPRILVTGSTGRIGLRVLRALADRQEVAVRALVRSDRSAELAAGLGVDTVRGDLTDPATLGPALDGVDRVFLLSTSSGDATPEANVADAAAAVGVERIVKLSSDSVGLAEQAGYRGPREGWPEAERSGTVVLHQDSELHLRASGLPSVCVRPTWWASLETMPWVAATFARGEFHWPRGGPGIAFVDPRDVADVCAHLLAAPDVEPATPTLTGPAALTPAEVADTWSRVLGRPFRWVEHDLDGWTAWLAEQGVVPEAVAGKLGGTLRPYTETPTPVTGDVDRLLGRPPRAFEDYVRTLG